MNGIVANDDDAKDVYLILKLSDVLVHRVSGEFDGVIQALFGVLVFEMPVAHDDRFRRPVEEISVVPTVVRPNPRTNPVLFALANEERKIALPQLACRRS